MAALTSRRQVPERFEQDRFGNVCCCGLSNRGRRSDLPESSTIPFIGFACQSARQRHVLFERYGLTDRDTFVLNRQLLYSSCHQRKIRLREAQLRRICSSAQLQVVSSATRKWVVQQRQRIVDSSNEAPLCRTIDVSNHTSKMPNRPTACYRIAPASLVLRLPVFVVE